MITATLLIGDKGWAGPAVCVVVLAMLLLFWAYRNVGSTLGIRMSAGLLKFFGVLLLAVCLVDPLWSGTRARPGANLFLLVADNSQSMQIHDAGRSQNRGESMKDLLGDGKSAWRVRLQQDFDVRSFRFDSRLERTEDFTKLDFSGDASSLKNALETIRERYRNRPTAGILLFTDGNASDFNLAEWDAADLPHVYPVLCGRDEGLKDIAIENVSVTQTSFEDAPVTVRVDISTHEIETGTKISARLLDERNQLVEERTLTLSDAGTSLSFRFRVRPSKPGITFYRLQVAAAEELEQFDDPNSSSEATLANNTRLIQVDRGAGPHRVLYVSGRPNWEFKFLNRAIEEDRQIELAALIRIAKKEAKFDFRGRTGESSNPLFRGFKKDSDEETERYDEPVFVRLNMKDSSELRGGFPKTENSLYAFHTIILDDVEAGFFTRDQMELLERFVSERGGGLLMLGGQESFRQGKYDRTPIGDMLPVYLDRLADATPNARYRLALTREGWLQPWARLRANEHDELKRIDEMPPFHTVNRIGSIKPGATIIAHVVDESGTRKPALIVQRYGRGRCAALTIGDFWRWGLKRKENSDDFEKAWRQLIRWMVADVPKRIAMQVKPNPETSSTAVRFEVRSRDDRYNPLDNATVNITVKPPSGPSIQLDAEPSLKEPGLYEAVYVPRVQGAFRAETQVTGSDGKQIGTDEAGWTSDPAEAEFQSVAVNRQLMQQLADETGGEIIAAEDLLEFVKTLPSRKAPITEQWTYPLWHQSWVFLLAICCFAGEWGLRRWKGLP